MFLVHSFLRCLFARAQAPCVIVSSSSSTTNILDSATTRIGFVKRSYKGGRMCTPLRIIKPCLPPITILNSLRLHHKTTYVTWTVNVSFSFFSSLLPHPPPSSSSSSPPFLVLRLAIIARNWPSRPSYFSSFARLSVWLCIRLFFWWSAMKEEQVWAAACARAAPTSMREEVKEVASEVLT